MYETRQLKCLILLLLFDISYSVFDLFFKNWRIEDHPNRVS